MQRGSKRCNQSYAGCASQVRIMRAWTYHFLRYKPLHEASYFPILINLGSLNWTHVIHAHDHDQFMIMIDHDHDHNSYQAFGNGESGKIFTSNWQKIAKMAKSYKKLPIHACSYWARLKRVLLGFARGFFCWKAKEILYKYVAIQYALMDPPTFYERNNVYTGFI